MNPDVKRPGQPPLDGQKIVISPSHKQTISLHHKARNLSTKKILAPSSELDEKLVEIQEEKEIWTSGTDFSKWHRTVLSSPSESGGIEQWLCVMSFANKI